MTLKDSLPLETLLDIILKGRKPADIETWTIDDVIVQNETRYHFISFWDIVEHKRLFIVVVVDFQEDFSFISFPANVNVIPVMETIGRLCGKSDQIDDIMTKMGYDV